MMTAVKEHGSLVMLDRLGECLAELTDGDKREELENLREYLGKRIAMTDYPSFLEQGYDIGSGPTESFCGCLTKRLKGSGMKWDKDNAESVMALASISMGQILETKTKRSINARNKCRTPRALEEQKTVDSRHSKSL